MRVDRLLATKRPVFSYEFFPPDDDAGTERLFAVIERLQADCRPDYVSVTCRHHSRERTTELVLRIRRELGLEPVAHLTCAGATREEMRGVLGRLQAAGVENVLALRGDPLRSADAPAGDLATAVDLAEMIRDEFDLCTGGACYPEVHSDAPDRTADMSWALRKTQAGCAFLVTQLFFDNSVYFDFVERAREAGITVPIIPGIMPIGSVSQLTRLSSTLFGARIPDMLRDALLRRADDAAAVSQLGTAYATLQCTELLAGGAPGIHFFTLNRSPQTRSILAALLTARPWERLPGGNPQ